MFCSECGCQIKPVVAVDIDGTLADYHGHFLRFCSDYFDWGRYGGDYDGSMRFKEWWMEAHQATAQDWHEVKLAYRQGGMKRTMPIFPGARRLCHSIKQADAELWVTTTRPYLSLDNIVPDTVEWCRRHGIAYDGMLFDEDKYARLAERIDSERVVAVLDDLPEMINAARFAFGSACPILIKGHYNWSARYLHMADLEAATEIVLSRIKEWKERHDGTHLSAHGS